MQTKLSILKNHASTGDWKRAIAIAAKFHDLGEQRNAILDAHIALTNPRWTRGLGKNVDAVISAGILALCARYGI